MSAPCPADCFSPDGEPLCLPPPQEELCEAARRRLPEVEADLRRRLSGPDRSIEAVQLERFAAGLRQAVEGPPEPLREGPPELGGAEDPLVEHGLLALCAAQLLGTRPLVHLAEGLALRGQRVRRSSLGPEQPPRALEVIEQLHRGERAPEAIGRSPAIEVCRASRGAPSARALVSLSAAGLAPPLVLIDGAAAAAATAAPFWHAGLTPALLDLVVRAAAPHVPEDAAAPMALLREALSGRNPWHLYQLVEVPWRDAWAGTQVLREPRPSAAGLLLLQEVLERAPTADEAFALGCHALGAAERLAALQVPAGPSPIVDESLLGEREGLLRQALLRLGRRPLLPGRGGEAALLLKAAAQSGLFMVMAHHPDELGRALLLAGAPGEGRSAQLRLLSFPREPPRALSVSERGEEGGRRSVCLDGGDLRAQLTFS